jgi:hypothetical protein
LPSEITYVPSSQPIPLAPKIEEINGSRFFEYSTYISFTNKSIRRGSIGHIELCTPELPTAPFRIIEHYIEKRTIRWNRKEKVLFKVIFEQNFYYNNNDTLFTQPLALHFFEEDGSQILDDKGNIGELKLFF